MAVEPSSTMRAQARSHPNLQWQDASAEALPFGDNQFDGAVMTLCLHHMDDWKKGLAEALRVSKDSIVGCKFLLNFQPFFFPFTEQGFQLTLLP